VEAASRIFVLRDGRTVATLEGEAISEPAVMNAMAHGHEPQGREALHV
jgi:ribose transport system ATP-binding protein